MPRTVTATYRLQLTRDFPFAAARDLVRYFERLGVSHLYLSPVLAARPGSTHGYDVIDHARVNPELGTEEELRALADELHAKGMGIILDIVPNHMAASEDNRWWDDVLERGPTSRYAEWFDVDWNAPHARGKVVLPVLGDDLDDVLERGELRVHVRASGARIAYFDRTLPLDPSTLPNELVLAQLDPAGRRAVDEWAAGAQGRERLRTLLDEQHYRLTFWRRAPDEINYRRFLEISDLVALRMESESVFDATHKLILDWVRAGVLDGLRVDHVDGLRFPSWYLGKLREAVDAVKHPDAPERFPILVEKILSESETPSHEWPVDGTTGYDFMNDVEEIFLDPAGFRAVEANYRGLRHDPSLSFQAVAREGKRQTLKGGLRCDVRRVARIAHDWRGGASEDELADAIVELIVHLDVYRTYLSEPGLPSEADRRALTDAFRLARERGAVPDAAWDVLEEAFFGAPSPSDTLRADVVMRLQQISGPAAAKGIEDTALYVYVPLASRNEVGGKPDRSLEDAPARLHAHNAARARDWPRTLLATNTHDTKRSPDVRARLDVLTFASDVWGRHVARWRRLNRARKRTVRGRPAPDTNSEYLYYQTLAGLWPAPRPERRADDLPDRAWLGRASERLSAYMLKAAREAKTRTSWTESDAQYERALEAFVRETLEPGEDAQFLPDVARLVAQTAEDGFRFSLARILLHCTSPGIPDIYQGDEMWTFALVDPDNRRPVDFQRRARSLYERESADVLRDALAGEGTLADDSVKLHFVARLLHFRRDHARLLRDGDYLPLTIAGSRDFFAFTRRHQDEACIAIARTRPPQPGTTDNSSATIDVPTELIGRWRSVFTGREIELVRRASQIMVRVDDLVAAQSPGDVLLRAHR